MFPNIVVNEIFKAKYNMEYHFNACILSRCDSANNGMKMVSCRTKVSYSLFIKYTYMCNTLTDIEYIYGIYSIRVYIWYI